MALVVDRVATPRGELVLRRDGNHYEVVSNGVFLMDTRDGRSERLLVRAALDAHPDPRRLLIGGLGVGFTLAEAVGDPRLESITVVEIEPALVRWHDGPLAGLSRDALADHRVSVVVADVSDHLRSGPAYDVICLDVDNGPAWTVSDANAALYDDTGIRMLVERLGPEGALAVWSASAVPAYEDRLRRHFGRVEVHSVAVARGEPDVVYVCVRGRARAPAPDRAGP